jgi:hypothetical protein
MRVAAAAVAAVLLTAFAALVLCAGGAPARGLFHTPLALPRGAWQPQSPARFSRSPPPMAVVAADDPKIQEAADRVTKAASAFGPDVKAYAEKWTRQMITDKQLSGAMLLEECLVDDTAACVELEEAIKSYRMLIGDWTGANAA